MTQTQTKTAILRGGFLSLLLVSLLAGLISAGAQAQNNMGNSLRGRLSPMPVTVQTVRTITGGGEVSAELNGSTLTVTGNFHGMSSVATMAHIHQGPKAQPGPMVLTLDVTKDVATVGSGTISATLTLTPELIAALHAEGLYVQIHSETNPGGELRGWLLH